MMKKVLGAVFLCACVVLTLWAILPFLVHEQGGAPSVDEAWAIPIDSYEIAIPKAMLWEGSAIGDTSLFDTATDTAYTDSVYVGGSQYYSAYLRATSADGTPNLKFYIMQAPHKDSTRVVPEGRVEFITVDDEDWHLISVEPVVCDYLWYRAIGQTGNGTDTRPELFHIEQPGRPNR